MINHNKNTALEDDVGLFILDCGIPKHQKALVQKWLVMYAMHILLALTGDEHCRNIRAQ